MVKRSLGDKGEAVAKDYLKKEGYRFLAANYTCQRGEIDLIALDGKTLVFVEVRSKSSLAYGTPIETVDRKKQTKIRRAAEHYLITHQQTECYCRFDVVSILWQQDKPKIELYKNAF